MYSSNSAIPEAHDSRILESACLVIEPNMDYKIDRLLQTHDLCTDASLFKESGTEGPEPATLAKRGTASQFWYNF